MWRMVVKWVVLKRKEERGVGGGVETSSGVGWWWCRDAWRLGGVGDIVWSFVGGDGWGLERDDEC